jgi:hypothetical protein
VKNWKIKTRMVAASMLSVLAGSTAWAQQPAAPPGELETLKRMMQEVISQNDELQRRIRELEAAMKKQEQATKEAAKEAAKELAQEAPKEGAKAAVAVPAPAPVKAAKGPLDKLQLGGALEVEARSRRGSRVDPSTTTRETGPRSDFALTTAEFDFEADVVGWAKAELAVEWSGDPQDDRFSLNEALITIGKPEKFPVYLKGGRGVVPFGISTGTTVAAKLEESLTLKGPLTVEAFEAKEDYVLLGARAYGFRAGAYVFNGETNKLGDITRTGGTERSKRLEHYGFTVGYELNTETVSFNAGIDMIDSVFDADGLFNTSAFPDTQINRRGREYTPGIAGHARFGFWGFSLVTEYNAAYRRHIDVVPTSGPLAGRTFRVLPQAWQVELGYTTEILGTKTYGAFNYSETSGLLGSLPKQRYIGTVGSWLADNIRLGLEYANEQDYPKTQRGTNRDADLWTLRLTYEW